MYTGIHMECSLLFNDLTAIDIVTQMKLSPVTITKEQLFTLIGTDHTQLESIQSMYRLPLPTILNVLPGNYTLLHPRESLANDNERPKYNNVFNYATQNDIIIRAMMDNNFTYRDPRVDQLIELISQINMKINDGTIRDINWSHINQLIPAVNMHPLDVNAPSRSVILTVGDHQVTVGDRTFPMHNADFCGMSKGDVNYIIEYLQALIENGATNYQKLQSEAVKYIALY